MNPESIYYLFEFGTKLKQEDYIWPIAGKATGNDRVFMVCDGAGSFYNGGVASKLICQFMAAKVLKFGEEKMSGELVDQLLMEARDRLVTYARENRLDTDLATTFSMLILYDEKVFLSWYGDSRIYQLRGEEILFRTEDNSGVHEPIHVSALSGGGNQLQSRTTALAGGIKADDSPISAETKWISDIEEGDYFLLCSKGLTENITDDDIKSLISQSSKENADPTGSFRRLAVEKAPDNYSMYLIRVNTGIQKRTIKTELIAIRKKTIGILPGLILALIVIALLMLVFYSPNDRAPIPTPEYKKDATQHVDMLRDDSVPNAIVMSTPRKAMPVVSDTVKRNIETPAPAPAPVSLAQPAAPDRAEADIQPVEKAEPADPTPTRKKAVPADPTPTREKAVQADPTPPGEKAEQTNQAPVSEKKRVSQLLIKLTTDESCKLKITDINLDNVIDWDLSENDDGKIYLKPGKYSIVATSVVNPSKTKTYNFDVKAGETNTTQNLNIRF